MNKLEDRLRSGLTAEAEAWQDPHAIEVAPRISNRKLGVLLTSAAAVLVLLIGSVMLLSGSGDNPPATDDESTPPTTMVFSDVESAPSWGSLVQEGLEASGIDLEVALAFYDTWTDQDLGVEGAKMFLATVSATGPDDMLLTVAYQSFSSTSEADTWPATARLGVGTETESGTLYVVDDDTYPAVFLVKPIGALSIRVEDPEALMVTSIDELRQLAIYLGSQIDVDGPADTFGDGGPFEAVPFSGDTWQFKVAEAATPGTGTYKVCYTFVAPGEITDDSGLGVSDCTEHPASTQTSEPPTYFVDLVRVLDTEPAVVYLVDLTSSPVHTVRFTGAGGQVLDVDPFQMPASGKQFAVAEVPKGFNETTVELLNATGGVLETIEGVTLVARRPGTPPTTMVVTPPQINVFVSNQSYADPLIDVTIEIDGEVVVSDTFDVGNQHDWHEFAVELGLGEHTMIVTSGTGVREAATFTIEEDSPLFAVVAFWGAEEDLDPRFVITFTDTPPGFA
ncbi:MAG: hypothetical protein ABFR95_04630 [Actinomycetota bacterium]